MNDRGIIMNSFSFLIDDCLKPSIIVDIDGEILHENESFKYLSGKQNSKNIIDRLDKKSADDWRSFVAKAMLSKEPVTESFPVSIQLDMLHNGYLNLFAPVGSQIVITKFTFDAILNILPFKKYIKAFNQSSNPMVIVDGNGIIRDLNIGYARFFKVKKADYIGANVSEMINGIGEFNSVGFWDMIKTKGFFESFKSIQHSAEDIRHYHITTYYDEETTMFFLELEDLTEKENLQLQLAHSGSLSAVGQIAASIAHEIRNPITTLKGFTQLLKATAKDDSLRYISVIEDEIDRMESILNEMLLLSKPAIRKKTIFSLERLICDMIALFHPKAMMDEIEIYKRITTEKDALLYGDSDKFKQVLLNLFKNALESMTKGGKLSIELIEKEGDIILSIADTGKGMTRHQVSQVFMPFFSSKAGGTGLGLPFVLKTVEEHGGTIAVESQIEKGTKFILTFPKMLQGKTNEISDTRPIFS